MARNALVAYLVFGILAGPNLCCCAFLKAAANLSACQGGERLACCCGEADDQPNEGCPHSPHKDGECPCKKSGGKDLLAPAAVTAADAGAFASAPTPFDAWVSSPAVVAPLHRAGAQGLERKSRLGGPSALALCPILRC